jgi:phosphoribosylamine--glycine ligase
MDWPVDFVPTMGNSAAHYAEAIIDALRRRRIDWVVPMPEALIFDGLVDQVARAGFGDAILGLGKEGAFIEGDKIRCKQLCQEAGVPVAPAWQAINARDYAAVLAVSLNYLDQFGGVVLKYPYSAGGKGARVILNAWEIREVYDTLINDYREGWTLLCGRKGPWPLLAEARMSGTEISFTILVDAAGAFQLLPTAMDYPERFEGPANKENPITGGTGAISPHPLETAELLEMAAATIAAPLVKKMKDLGILRPCVLYPGCFVSFSHRRQPTGIRVCEVNIRPGEPEAQPVARRLRNLGALVKAALSEDLAHVAPEVRTDQVAICIALMTGPGGPDGQKGYPWSCTKGEIVEMDLAYLKKKGIQLIPSAMTYLPAQGCFKSDGTRVAYLNANATIKPGDARGPVADRLREKLLAAFDAGKVRVIPRENNAGNRLDLRRDIGRHYLTAEKLFP